MSEKGFQNPKVAKSDGFSFSEYNIAKNLKDSTHVNMLFNMLVTFELNRISIGLRLVQNVFLVSSVAHLVHFV